MHSTKADCLFVFDAQKARMSIFIISDWNKWTPLTQGGEPQQRMRLSKQQANTCILGVCPEKSSQASVHKRAWSAWNQNMPWQWGEEGGLGSNSCWGRRRCNSIWHLHELQKEAVCWRVWGMQPMNWKRYNSFETWKRKISPPEYLHFKGLCCYMTMLLSHILTE